MNAYNSVRKMSVDDQALKEHMQDRQRRMEIQDEQRGYLRDRMAHEKDTWNRQDEVFQHQQQTWKNQEDDRQYAISQRPMNEQLNQLRLASQTAGVAMAGTNLAMSSMKYQMMSSDAVLKQHAIDYIEAAARGKSMMPTSGKITSYGYQADEYRDSNSLAGIGAFVSDADAAKIKAGEDTPSRLKPGDIALSPDTRDMAIKAGIRPGEPMTLHFADGTTHTGRYMDHTADEVKGQKIRGRYDIYSPTGVHQFDGKQVTGFSRGADGLPTADQLDRMMDVATLTKDPNVIARAMQVKEANEIRPDVQAQRNVKLWNTGFDFFRNRTAALPPDVARAAARMAGISENPESLPPVNAPTMWNGVLDRLDKAITEYNKDPATFRRVQIAGEPKTIAKGSSLTSSSLSHVITSLDGDAEHKDLRDAAARAFMQMITTYENQQTGNSGGSVTPKMTTPTHGAGKIPDSLRSKAEAFMNMGGR